MKNLLYIPKDLSHNQTVGCDVQMYNYSSSIEKDHRQVILQKNGFNFLLAGTKKIATTTFSTELQAGQVLMMKKGNCIMSERLASDGNYESILLFFTEDKVIQFLDKYEIAINPKKNKVLSTFEADHFIIKFIESLQEITKRPTEQQPYYLDIKLEELFLYLIEKFGTNILAFFIENHFKNDTFERVIQNYQYNKISLSELAFLCNMSVSTFKREFKKRYDEPPMRWFLNKRLEYAHFILQSKKKKPSEVAFEIGYEHLSSFSKEYKAKYQVSPRNSQ